MFTNPIKDGYITSKFGYRTHPVTGKKQSFHQGVDIARQPNDHVKVLASADGEVIRVGALGTYGNVVMIRHNFQGKIMETNYAHLKLINVNKGDKIKQGEVIGIMGNTGSSTAPHLHFEIHDGRWAQGQPNAVDPEKYIELYNRKETELMRKELNELKAIVSELVKDNQKVYNRTKASEWAESLVDEAIKKGITDGKRLDANITREEAIVVVMRALKLK